MVRMLTDLHNSYQEILLKNRIKLFNRVIELVIKTGDVEATIASLLQSEGNIKEKLDDYDLFCIFRSLRDVVIAYWDIRAMLSNESFRIQRFLKCLYEVSNEALHYQLNSKVSKVQAFQHVIYNLRELFDKR